MEDSTYERADAGNRAADERIAAAGELPCVRKPLRERHADPRPDRGGEAGEEGDVWLVGGQRDGEDRRQRGERAVDQARHRGLDALEEKDLAVAHSIRVYQTACKYSDHKASLTTTVRMP
ncbi:MAG: hypothetical protein E6G19_08750 [Actinobacteria bacterium]|nr:MAG: hypothetical protein E6G19_08750 [Actinomycetota bacterium]